MVCSYLIAFGIILTLMSGIAFQSEDSMLSTPSEILANEEPIAISIDGKAVREIPGPKGLSTPIT